MTLGYLAAVLSTIVLLASGDKQCPFDTADCVCSDSTTANVFDTATCTMKGQLPRFVGADGTYSITNEFSLTFSADTIPTSKAFSVFKSIKMLSLIKPTSQPPQPPAQWAPDAFAGPSIRGFEISGVPGVLPPPPALVQIAPGLNTLSISACEETITLQKGGFAKFTALDTLNIQKTQIATIADGAFDGMTNLGELSIQDAALSQFPTGQFRSLSKLFRLDLSRSGIQQYTNKDFSSFPSLLYLDLTGNGVQAAIDSGALLALPSSVNTLNLGSAVPPLKLVPSKVINNAKQITDLSLTTNAIAQIKNGDFPAGNSLVQLSLVNNPITQIESNALQTLTQVSTLDLTGSSLVSFDFSLLNGLNNVNNLILQFTSTLKSLNVTGSDLSLPNLAWIDASNTALVTIDPKLEKVLGGAKFRDLDLQQVTTIECSKDIAWLAKYALCKPTRITAGSNTKCSDGKLLVDYLTSIAASDVCTATGPVTTGGTTTGTTPATKGALKFEVALPLTILGVLVAALRA